MPSKFELLVIFEDDEVCNHGDCDKTPSRGIEATVERRNKMGSDRR